MPKTIARNSAKRYENYGFFGPGSVTWKVFRYPSSFTVGFQRTVVSEMYEPFLMASVSDTEAVMKRPAARYDRTLQYVSTVAFADSPTVVKASDILLKIHSHIRGKEPISGGYYDANDPEAQLWIHLTQWHSVLLAYEVFGPGKLSEEEENQYWAECRIAAEFQTIDPESVPRNRQEMRDYYTRMRPRLAATEATQKTVQHLLDATTFLLDDLPLLLQPLRPAMRYLFRKATIATLPGWMRQLGGVRQSALEDVLAISVMRPLLGAIALLPDNQLLRMIEALSPGTAKVVAPILADIAPVSPTTVTPAEAWATANRPTPRAQYNQHKAERAAEPEDHAPKDPGTNNLLQFA
ncbi:oxygenase MpaB family protein [Marinobacter mobilis]|uniref:Uncharacterized conserved protein, DUF2236 family n=1 Tax=Marinobacter mobilis TaxID=488533 RepID=A0A1H2SCC9_9GAMM|nr:oxygenase MpaB family protein [Marinobacter mobilis]SDW29157.1 Uncharacterized conserved protein, DUF2236 family [Marinobacter mobilis]